MADFKFKVLRWTVYGLVVVLCAGAAGLTLALQQNIANRKQEAAATVFQIATIDETTVDPAQWGKNYPRQYDGYKRTVDTELTRYGGSEAFQKLDSDPRWRDIFAGYAFSIDYREERGHAYMLSDQRETERVTKRKQPGACVHCHASNTVAYRKAGLENGAPGAIEEPLLSTNGQAQLMKGFEAVCAMPFEDASKRVEHPVACVDCHDPSTMALRVTRPGFLNGIRALAESNGYIPNLPSVERWRAGDRKRPYDPNIDASRQEMRSMACAQCHVEYYFKGEGKLVTYPWHNGIKADEIEKYYDGMDYKDWTHAISGAPVLKAQHPEFELWSQGIHARSGVSCADCHMPYKREGAIKVSDHHVRSPLLNVAHACQVCHNYPESEIQGRVAAIQDRTSELLSRGTDAVNDLIKAIQAAKTGGATDDALKEARDLQRKAQWRLDFIAAENSMGFHAPQEAAKVLAEAIDYARRGETSVAKLGKPAPAVAAPPEK